MLVLARKAGQSVVIDGNIRVTVDRIRGRVVRLKVEAPREIRKAAPRVELGPSCREGPCTSNRVKGPTFLVVSFVFLPSLSLAC